MNDCIGTWWNKEALRSGDFLRGASKEKVAGESAEADLLVDLQSGGQLTFLVPRLLDRSPSADPSDFETWGAGSRGKSRGAPSQ